jgi:hypothetical protein
MIYNVVPGTFNNYGIRNGDLVAMINFFQWFRKSKKREDIKLHIKPKVLVDQEFTRTFFNLLNDLTDCFSLEEGYVDLPYYELMLWDFRDIIGDHVSIKNPYKTKKKIVVFPVYDAQYHTTRNWSLKLFDDILQEYSDKYKEYEKIVCVKDSPGDGINLHGFQVSTDFNTNMIHLMESEIFIGGDTGTSHFASALDIGPRELTYYYNGRGMIHTLPFYLLEGKGRLKKFWVNCEGTKYNGKLII